MGLESGVVYIEDLVATNPNEPDNDTLDEADNHLRIIKTAVQGSFPSLGSAAVTKTAAEINDLVDKSTTQTITGTKTLASPVLTDPLLNGDLSGGSGVSNDATMAGDSATEVVTEHAAKTYTDSKRAVQTIDSVDSAEWTGISADAKEIVITFSGIDASGALLLTVGHSAAYQSTGYIQGVTTLFNTQDSSADNITITKSVNDFELTDGTACTDLSGTVTLTLHDAATYIWTVTGTLYDDKATDRMYFIAGRVTMTDTLTRILVGRGGSNGSIGAIIKT